MLNQNHLSGHKTPQTTPSSPSTEFSQILSSTGLHYRRNSLPFDNLDLGNVQSGKASPDLQTVLEANLGLASNPQSRDDIAKLETLVSGHEKISPPQIDNTQEETSPHDSVLRTDSQASSFELASTSAAQPGTMAAIAAIVVPLVLGGIKEIGPIVVRDIKSLIDQAVAKFEKAHPGQTIWQVFGASIAHLWRDNHIDQKIYNALHLGAFVAKVSNFSQKLIKSATIDPALITPPDVVAHWDTAKLIDLLADDNGGTNPATVRKNMFKLEPVGTMVGMLNKDKFTLPGNLKSHVVDVLTRFNEHNAPKKPDPVPIPTEPPVKAPEPSATTPSGSTAKPPVPAGTTTSVTPSSLPTVVLRNSPPVAPPAPKPPLTPQWLAAHPQAMGNVPEEERPVVLQTISSMLRIQAISPTTTAMQELMKNGAPSSKAITRNSKVAWVATNKASMGAENAQLVFNNAQNQVIRLDNMGMGLLQLIRGSGLTQSDDGNNPAERKLQVQEYLSNHGYNLSIEALFGSLDDATAPDSHTVYSPAAYFVELLGYLRNNNMDPASIVSDTSPKGTADSIDGTVLQYLFRRRPDLGNLELTPENSDTVLPYIDLVNEIMESFIVNLQSYRDDGSTPKQAEIDVYNVTTQDSEELLSQPQNVSLTAYRQLATAAYPISLPYHQPIDVQRIFLNYLNLPRAELVDAFRPKPPALSVSAQAIATAKGDPNPLKTLTDLQKKVLDRQAECERLSITQEEYLILTKNVFWPQEFFSLTEGIDVSSDAYVKRIGAKSTPELWGYNSADTLLDSDQSKKDGLQFVKKQLLPRAGIAYTDLISIVQTSFVNPIFPSGRNKTILDSLRFSYTFLSALVDQDTTTSQSKYSRVADFLVRSQKVLDLAKELTDTVEAPPGQDNGKKQDPTHIKNKEIRQWVLSNFGQMGQIIVLDAGQGPQLEVTGVLNATNNDVTASALSPLPSGAIGKLTSEGKIIDVRTGTEYKSGPVGMLLPDGSIKDGNKDIFSRVNIAGRVVYGNPIDDADINTKFPKVDFSLAPSGPAASWVVTGGYLRQPSPNHVVEWTLNANLGGSASLEDVRLVHLNGDSLTIDEWDRLHRFIRIWRKLGWSVDETDRALAGINACLLPPPKTPTKPADLQPNGTDEIVDLDELITFDNFSDATNNVDGGGSNSSTGDNNPVPVPNPDITTDVITELAAISQLLKMTGLPIEQLLTLWTNIPLKGIKTSLFYRLFFTRRAGTTDPAFTPDANGDFFTGKASKISDHKSVVTASFSLKSKDLEFLLGLNQPDSSAALVPDVLNLDNLSTIYRAILFARLLGVNIADIPQIAAAFVDPDPDPTKCLSALISQPTKVLSILQIWAKINDASFPWTELRYILDSVPSPLDPLAPTEIDALRLAKTLHDGILDIQAANPFVTDEANATDDLIQSKTTLVFDADTVSGILGLIHGTTVYTTSAPAVQDKDFATQVASSVSGAKYILGPEPPKGSALTQMAKLQITGILSSAQVKGLQDLILPFCVASPPTTNGSITKKKKEGSERGLKADWKDCIERITAQSTNFFYDALVDIFPPSALTSLQGDESKIILLAPDLSPAQINQVQDYQIDLQKYNQQLSDLESKRSVQKNAIEDDSSISDGEEDQGLVNGIIEQPIPPTPPSFKGQTPQAKALYFLQYFIPFLQARLAHSFVIDTVADIAGFSDHALAKIFLEEIAVMDQSKQSAIEFLLTSLGAKPSVYQGHLTPPADGSYIFYLPDDTRQPDPIMLDDVSLQFNKTKIRKKTYWTTQSIHLSLKEIYTFSIDSTARTKLKWKRDSNAIVKVNETTFSAWRGYINPSSLDSYVLSVSSDTQPPSIVLDNSTLPFSQLQQQDPEKIWATEQKIALDPTKLYSLELIGLQPSDLYWKSSGSIRSAIPASSFLPDYSKNQTLKLFDKMKKIGLILSHFALSSDEIVYVQSRSTSDDFDHLDFNSLADVTQWTRLYDYLALRKSLPAKTTQSLLDLFAWSNSNANASQEVLATQISLATTWSQLQIHQILTYANFTTGKASDFVNEVKLLRIQKLIGYANLQLGVDIPRIFEWTAPLGTNTRDFYRYGDVAQDIQNMTRSKFSLDQWATAVRPLNDTLRENQKNGLIAYLLVQEDLTKPNNITDANGLFEYFLIDVQMTPLVETSRLKQAISTVQLFVQRCMLGLEASRGVKASALDRQRWQWMQKYRVWEGNRKIFLYPENWIDPSLRDDKSEIFLQLEAELLQKDLTNDAVNTALKTYLYSVNQVANLQCISLYVDFQDANKLHVFARTRAIPYAYYYNWYQPNGDDGFWNGWTRMEVDIPHYVTSNPNAPTGHVGNHVAPISFNGSLVLFIAQIMPYTQGQDMGNGQQLGNLQTMQANSVKPLKSWQVQMGWTEYRNGKWTPRQNCSTIYTMATSLIPVDIDSFKIVPAIVQSAGKGRTDPADSIKVWLSWGDTDQYNTVWWYNGTQVTLPTSSLTATLFPNYIGATSFGYLNGYLRSWQTFESDQASAISISPSTISGLLQVQNAELFTALGPQIWLYDHDPTTGTYNAQPFYHSIINQLLQGSTDPDPGNIFKSLANISADPTVFGGNGQAFNERRTAYSLYNWELGLHAPMILIDRLFKAAQYEQALQVCQYIFNPLATGDDTDMTRFWVFPPFKTIKTQTIEEYFLSFTPGKPNSDVLNWRNKPFAPHVVARGRPQAYMQWVVMKYIQILIAWGDDLFRQNSLESIPLAIQCYVYADSIYGPRGQQYPRQPVKAETYNSLMTKLDAFDNAIVQLEEAFPFSNQTPLPVSKLPNDQSAQTANIFGSAGTLYFAIPDNPDLRALASTIDDRLFKIRHSQDINGIFRQLPLQDPPIDPGLLVLAAAQGLNLNSVLTDLNGPLPNCRFVYLLEKAKALTQEVRSFGASLLSNKEKCDGELLSNLRSKHELATTTSMLDLKQLALDDANAALALLQYQRASAVERLTFYFNLIGSDLSGIPQVDSDYIALIAKIDTPVTDGGLAISPAEQLEMQKLQTAADLNTAVGAVKTVAGILHALPNVDPETMPLGLGVSVRFGPENFAKLTESIASGLSIGVERLNFEAGSASRLSQHQRAIQERIMTANSTGFEISNIDRQITAAKIRIQMATHEINQQQQQIDQAREVNDFLQSKYTNIELYSWIDGQTKTLYYQTYSAAFALAMKAQKAFCFERPQKASSSFIQPGYWDASRNGLLSGETLAVALQKLEAAYIEEKGYDYEITKAVSLRRLDPLALIALREAGACQFSLPEVIYDMDFPGHYMRRIKSVAITIPCLVGPFTSVNATLRLQSSKYRVSAIANKYPEDLTPGADPDPRFSTSTVPIPAIAASSALDDDGLFQLRFDDNSSRYLPFEGAGAISNWTLELPGFKQFDYGSITDVVLRIKYTSLEGGGSLRSGASKNVADVMKLAEHSSAANCLFTLFDVKNDFASGWSRLTQAYNSDSADLSLQMPALNDRLPIFTTAYQPKQIIPVAIWILTDTELPNGTIQLTSNDGSSSVKTVTIDSPPVSGPGQLKCYTRNLEGEINGFGSWTLTFGKGKFELTKCLMVVSYRLDSATSS